MLYLVEKDMIYVCDVSSFICCDDYCIGLESVLCFQWAEKISLNNSLLNLFPFSSG